MAQNAGISVRITSHFLLHDGNETLIVSGAVIMVERMRHFKLFHHIGFLLPFLGENKYIDYVYKPCNIVYLVNLHQNAPRDGTVVDYEVDYT